MAPAPPGKGPFVIRRRLGAWTVRIHSEVGPARHRLEDAWSIVPEAHMGSRTFHALGLFDGVGGAPHGQAAAWAAADTLPKALADADCLEDALRILDQAARGAGGASTAAVALLDTRRSGSGALLSVGDSAAYTLDTHGALRLLNPMDRRGPGWLTDHLGNPGLAGHVLPMQLPREAPLLLCTDGVHDVAGPEALLELLTVPEGALDAALEVLFDRLREAGMPDNATAVLAHPDV